MARLKTQLEAAGAEYLVLGHLLRRKIQSFICSQNFEDYDIVATNPEKNKSLKIQVKSRFRVSATGFPIKKFGSDIVIFVRLNCGRVKKKQPTYTYEKEPEFYIFPTELCLKVQNDSLKNKWGKISINVFKITRNIIIIGM